MKSGWNPEIACSSVFIDLNKLLVNLIVPFNNPSSGQLANRNEMSFPDERIILEERPPPSLNCQEDLVVATDNKFAAILDTGHIAEQARAVF